MTNTKSTKRALVASVLVLALCFSMLVGTTFAWFTDSVTSGNNVIQSGNLDIALDYWNGSDWATVDKADNIFDKEALWEPGYTEVVYLRAENLGSLALKYHLAIKVLSETDGVNQNGESFKLSDYIQMGVIEGVNGQTGAYDKREDAVAALTSSSLISEGYGKPGYLEKGADPVYLAVVVYMPESVGNVANHNGTTVPKIELGINVIATQYTYEEDSFGDDYDKDTFWTGLADTDWYFEDPTATEFTLSTAEELAGLAEIVNGTAIAPATTFAATAPTTVQDTFSGKTIKLDKDINLYGIEWTPIGRIGTTSTDFTYSFKGSFDGQNHTVSGLDVTAYGWAGFFGIAYGADINNLTIKDVSIKANRMAGAVVGQLYGSINNCHVEDATIMVTPNRVGNSYDNGDKVGGIVGWIGDNGNNRTLTNCSATDVEIGAYRDVGGIAGYVASSTKVSGNEADKVTITVDQTSFFYGEKDSNAGAIVGRDNGAIDGGNTTGEEITITSTVSRGGLTLKEDGVTGTVTLYLVPAEYTDTTVTVPEGVTNIGGYAFAYNSNIEKIVLPSTVKALNDRAFRDTSASEVVLNEGLTVIPYQTFRNATNLKSITIPSTVTTINKEAFQNSGIETLTIPANVTTLEYGACRDMKMLESVVIEGNVDIPVYAFRACTNLKSVTITGNDVKFGQGTKGMIFTNKESGDGTAITVTVPNEVIRDRLLAADTAAKDYGGYTIVCSQTTTDSETGKELGYYKDENGAYAYNSANLSSAITNDEKDIYVANGEYNLPSLNGTEGVTIIGSEGTVIGGDEATTGFGANFGKDTTIKNVSFEGSSNGVRWSYANGGTSTFENCTFAGDSTYGFHIDESNGATFIFNNCTFSGFNAFAGDLEKITFNNCTFLHNGNYGHTNIWSVAEFNGCTWGDNTSVSAALGGKLYFDGTEESYHHEFIGSAESLFAFAESVNVGNDSWSGQKVLLVNDIDLENKTWTPIGQTGATEFKGIFDGQGYTIKNLYIDSSAQTGEHYSSGLFGWAEGKTVIKNVNVDGATVIGNHNVAVIVGYTYSGTVSGCNVKNANIVCNHANDDACGDKVGIIAGYAGDESRFTDCSATDCTVKGGRDAGQLIGCGYNVSVKNCSATNVTVEATGECTGKYVNEAIIGRVMG